MVTVITAKIKKNMIILSSCWSLEFYDCFSDIGSSTKTDVFNFIIVILAQKMISIPAGFPAINLA